MAFQATSGSKREKWVATFIPAVAIFMGAFFYFSFYASPELQKVEGKYNSAVRGTVTPDVIAQLEWSANKLRDERDQLNTSIRSGNEELQAKSQAFRELSPTAKHSAVIALCREQGVAILKDDAIKDVRLPHLRQTSVETLASLVPPDSIGFRELTVSANYTRIVALLIKLPEIPGVVPVSVKLEKGKAAPNASPEISWTFGLLM
ncbi:MAG: hypothetical protein AAFU85_03340 [Planctomycetota bacterium]